MKPGPRMACSALIEGIDLVQPPRDAVDCLTDIIMAKGWTGKFPTPRENAEAWQDSFLKYLRRELDELNRLGRYAPFVFNTSADYKVQGAAFAEPLDTAEVLEQKEKRARFKSYTSALRTLTPTQFECLCAGVLSLIGAEGLRVTAYSGDRGIDFYCRLRLERHIFQTDLYPNWHRQLNVWMVGQAKHYIDGTVSIPEINNLVGAVKLLSGPTANRKRFPDLIVRSCDPVFLLFFTTGRLSADCWSLLDESGVVGMDSEMLAAFLADREVGCSVYGFDLASFSKWIEQFER
jgi:hypothetical protein